ncbi:MAG: hypothetical protein IJU12_00525 [Clostridia bacterium]|nr:hypothetical protein [Clostridia bacterium]
MTKEAKRFCLGAAILCALCLLLEGVLFQGDALGSRGLTQRSLSLADARIETEEIARELSDVEAVMPSNAEAAPVIRTRVIWEELGLTDIRTAALTFTGDRQLIRAELSLRDDAHRYGDARADQLPVLPGETSYARLESHGVLHALTVQFETEDASAALESLTLNAPIPYRFSPLRLALLLLPSLGACAVLCFRLWTVILDRRKTAHRLCYLLAAALCLLLVLTIRGLCVPEEAGRFPYARAIEYPFESDVYRYRSLTHAVLYDMLAQGRVSIPVEPDARLLALENPYDPTARLESRAEVLFDYALHDGQYYSYFGLTPVLTFYAPYKLLMGYLPSYTAAACFFALLTVAAAFLCVWEAARRFIQKPTVLALCLTAAAVALGSHALMLQASADRYHLTIACMQAFFFLVLWSALAACRQRTPWKRGLTFAACGFFTVLLTGSRATGALAAAGWVIPLFVLVLLGKKRGPKGKALDALCFLAPLLAGAAGLMAYNAARFGSPFEFGQTWQLTLEDIHYNRVRLRDLLPAFYYYYLDGLRLTAEFPFVTLCQSFVNHSGNWFYAVANAGAFTVPITWGLCLVFALPDKTRRGKLAVYLTAACVTLPLALISYAVAGVAHRYVCDILPTLCLAGGLTGCELASRDAREGRGAASLLLCLLCACTFLVALGLTFSNYRDFISQYAPGKYLALYRLFTLR